MLQITSEPRAPRQVQLTIVVPPERVQREIDALAKTVARQRRIPGYRPGKAPPRRVAELVGEDTLREEAVGRLAKRVALEAIQAEKLEPAAPIHVGVLADEPLTIQALVPLSPAVSLGNYRALRVEIPEVRPVEDADVDGVIEELRRDLAEVETVDRPAEAGDRVGISLVGRFAAGDGAASEVVFEGRDLDLRLLPEDVAAAGAPPAVIDHIVGLGAGDHAAFDVTYSELWPEPRLQGRVAAFEADVATVRAAVPPTPEALAERLSAPSPAALRERIGAQLRLRAILDARTRLVDEAMAALVDQAEVEYPPALLELNLAELIHDLRQRVEREGLTWERWLALQEGGQEALEDELERIAVTRLRQSWVMAAFAEVERITVSKAALEAEVNRVVASLAREFSASGGRQRPNRDAVRAEVMARMVYDLALARLLEIVTDGATTADGPVSIGAAALQAAVAELAALETTAETPVVDVASDWIPARAAPARTHNEEPREG